ncbi:MAG: 5-formyltetrahydrofolate cyclo-ligase [Alphaproteobacteria bacterium]
MAEKEEQETGILPSSDSHSMPSDLRSRKRQLRAEAELLRRTIKDKAGDAGRRTASLLLDTVRSRSGWPEGAVVSSYSPRGSEMDVDAVDHALIGAGFDLALPVVLGRGHPLAFRRYRPGDALTKGVLDVMEPLASAPIVAPRILLVPLLAFDRRGNRLGYGGGYYDRTVALFRREAAIQAIGVAFAEQEMEDIPVGGMDAPLDWIVTEKEALFCRALES